MIQILIMITSLISACLIYSIKQDRKKSEKTPGLFDDLEPIKNIKEWKEFLKDLKSKTEVK